MKEISISTSDTFMLKAHYFKPVTAIGKTMVIAGGVGMPQRFFFNIANWLASKGFNTYTFDYRGIALSRPIDLREMSGSYYDWVTKDFEAITAYVVSQHNTNTLCLLGHSFGGNSLGMSKSQVRYDKVLMVGSQYGYYRLFPLQMQFLIQLNFAIFTPVLTRFLGYFPSKWFGLGEPLPSQVAKDWATTLLTKDSFLTIANKHKTNFYHQLKQPMLLISIDDDSFAPKKSVDYLAEKVFINADTQRLHLVPKDYNLKQIGHNDFFRKSNRDMLWPIVTDWFHNIKK